jgi:hypothetical protein
MWDSTFSPVRFQNMGKRGIYLLGQFSADTTLSFIGKCAYKTLGDTDTWVLAGDNAIIAGAAGDMIRNNDRDDNRATIRYKEYQDELLKMIDLAEAQGTNEKSVVPVAPWTSGYDYNTVDISVTGSGALGYIL